MQETQVQSQGWEDPLEKEMATHSSILAWEIPCTKEPGRATVHGVTESDTTEQLSTCAHACTHTLSEWRTPAAGVNISIPQRGTD